MKNIKKLLTIIGVKLERPDYRYRSFFDIMKAIENLELHYFPPGSVRRSKRSRDKQK